MQLLWSRAEESLDIKRGFLDRIALSGMGYSMGPQVRAHEYSWDISNQQLKYGIQQWETVGYNRKQWANKFWDSELLYYICTINQNKQYYERDYICRT